MINGMSIYKKIMFHGNPIKYQETLLLKLIRENSNTMFGKANKFTLIKTMQEYLDCVPPKMYSDFSKSIDMIMSGNKDVLFHGTPSCFGTTSGTEGETKSIPYNKKLLWDTRKSAMESGFIGSLLYNDFFCYMGKILYIGPRKAEQKGKWKFYSEGTAFIYLLPCIYKTNILPKYEELPTSHEGTDYNLLNKLIKNNKITAVAGNPIEIIKYIRQSKIVIPEVKMVFNCGYWVQDFMHIYKSAFPNANIVDAYATNEGNYGLPFSPGIFILNYKRVFFSFLPIDAENTIFHIGNVTLKKKYLLCVTTSGGMWNYITGDIVSFEKLNPPIIKLCGRKNRALQIGNGWLTEDEVVGAVRNSGTQSIGYYIKLDKKRIVLYIDDEKIEAAKIDEYLCRVNMSYKKLRDSFELEPLSVQNVKPVETLNNKPARIINNLVNNATVNYTSRA